MSYQFIWWWKKPRFFYRKLCPADTDLAYVYDWMLGLGFLEIRKWQSKEIQELKNDSSSDKTNRNP